MELSETLGVFSIEDFLLSDEIARIFARLDDVLRGKRAEFEAGRGGRSVHGIEGMATADVVAIYEPAGRIEIAGLPTEITSLMDAALGRSLASLNRVFPSARRPDDWVYLEYGPGQHITPHADYAHNDDHPDHPKVTGMSVMLDDAFTGGEFFVETCGADQLWRAHPQGPRLIDGADFSTEWFRELPRTRWMAKPARGTALFYGSQLVHGTVPIASGRARKIIGFVSE